MAVTRRAVLKGALASGVGVIAGSGGYGFLYERHQLEVTRATVRVVGLPPALAGLRIGFITDVHRSGLVSHDDVAQAVSALTIERPDLVILGGDYVTWGDRQYVRRSSGAAVRAAWRVRHPRQPRRRSRHAGGAWKVRRADVEGCTHAVADPQRNDRSGRHSFLDETPNRHRSPDARRRADDVPARARPAAVHRGGCARRAARAVRPHAWRPGGASSRRRPRRGEISRGRRARPARPDGHVREPGRGDDLPAGADQLSAGGGGAGPPACLNPPNTAWPASIQTQSTAANPACLSQTK